MSDQAMKLFEALSGVDEELLERCNDQKVNRKNITVHRWFWRYGRTMAACICLIVVGAAAWSGYRLVMGSWGSANSSGSGQSMNTSPAELSDMAQSVAVMDEGSDGYRNTGSDDTTAEVSMGSTTETAGEGARQEVGTGRIESEMENTAAVEAATQTPGQSQMEANKTNDTGSSGDSYDSHAESTIAERMAELLKRESALSDSRQMISWGEACSLEPFAGYLPTALPAGYEAFSARQSALPDEWNNVIFKWSDGEHILSLNMTQGEVMTREEIDRRDGVNEYPAEEIRKELISGAQLDGHIYFTLYYADGMRIDFDGYITVDEMWEIVESVSK